LSRAGRELGRVAGVTLLIAALLAALAAGPAAAMGETAGGGGGPAPAVNQNEVEEEVMCPVCGTLLALADSPQAQREKTFLARLIGEGKSKTEVKDALVAEYGDGVLALPQHSGFDLSAYLVPIIGFVVAAGALGFGVYRWRRESEPPDDRPAASRGPNEADSARLDADLGRYDL
jgi:cytochrome c-type biogenesis protein CcmH